MADDALSQGPKGLQGWNNSLASVHGMAEEGVIRDVEQPKEVCGSALLPGPEAQAHCRECSGHSGNIH